MAYINVGEVYILDNTGLQVDMATDIPFADAGFTDAQKEQARKNIAAGGTNPNLLDNPWFTVNQRGETTVSGSGKYIADRWGFNYGSSSNTATRNSDGTITLNGAGGYAQIREKLEPSLCSFLIGKTITLSIMFSDNTVFSATYNVTEAAQYYTYVDGSNSYISLDLRSATQYAFFLAGGENKTIKAMKLELGSVSTLANDVPPDYGTELLKCQRYFVRLNKLYAFIGTGFAQNATNAWVFIPTPVPLRETASLVSISYTGVYVSCVSSLTHTITALGVNNSNRAFNANGVSAFATTTGLTVGEPLMLMVRESGGHIDISADL